MPTNQRFRTNDLKDLQYRRRPAIELDKEQPVTVRQPNLASAVALLNHQLMPKSSILRLNLRLRSKRQDKNGKKDPDKPDHPISLRDSLPSSIRMTFSVQTGGAVSRWPRRRSAM